MTSAGKVVTSRPKSIACRTLQMTARIHRGGGTGQRVQGGNGIGFVTPSRGAEGMTGRSITQWDRPKKSAVEAEESTMGKNGGRPESKGEELTISRKADGHSEEIMTNIKFGKTGARRRRVQV